MRTLTLAQVEDLEHGVPIPRLLVRVLKVLDQKSGEGQYGVWHLQTLFVEDADGDEAALTWTGEDAFEKSAEGQTYEFSAGTNKAGALIGVMRDVRQKGDKTYSGIKVTPAAKIKLASIPATPDAPESDAGVIVDEGGIIDPPAKDKGEHARTPIVEPLAPRSKSRPLDSVQRAIIRQHSQSMALELLKLKLGLKELGVEDLTPTKLKQLADYFDQDVIGAAE